MMTVNNMARNAMMTGAVGGTNPLFGNQKASAQNPAASGMPFGADLQAGMNPAFATGTAARDAGKGMQNAVQDRQSAYSQYQGTSSNEKTAVVDDSKATQATKSSMSNDPVKLEVKQTAQAQTNEGKGMDSSKSAVEAGEYSFSIEAGGKTHNFTINVDENDDNASIQEKMAAAINKQDIGVTATVTADDKTGTTSLSLASDETGTDAAFTVKDESGNLAESMGVTDSTQKAQNAVYSVNGGAERTSQSNDVKLADGVTATLKGAGTTSISAERDTKSATEAAKKLVDAINTALKNAGAGDGRGAARLANDIKAMNRNFSGALAGVGITVSRNGELSIDEAKLEKAAQDGRLERVLGNEQSGFGARAERIANNAVDSEYYADIQANFSFDRGQLLFQKLQSVGMLFNMLA